MPLSTSGRASQGEDEPVASALRGDIQCQSLKVVQKVADVLDDVAIRARTRTGRPCGDKAFVRAVEDLTGRNLEPQPPGPKPAARIHLPGQGDLFDE